MVCVRVVSFHHTFLLSILMGCCSSCVGCYWGCSFARGFSYADDVLLAPSASALRIMLNICCTFSVAHKLEFNANKTQLICFHAPSVRPIAPTIYFNGTKLSYSDQVVHLGHILTSNLDDTADIMRTVKDMNKKQTLSCVHSVLLILKLKRSC